MGYTTQLLIALVYKTGTKLMLRQSSSTLVKYVNYLIVISININEKIISQNSFTHLFNIQMTKFIYSRLLINEILEIIDKSQKNKWVCIHNYSYHSC